MIVYGQDVAEEFVLPAAEDYFGDAPTWDDPFGSGVWHEEGGGYGDFYVVLPFHYSVDNIDVANWLESEFPTMYKGDNSTDVAHLEDYFNGALIGSDYESVIECVRVTSQRVPASGVGMIEIVFFHVHFDELEL